MKDMYERVVIYIYIYIYVCMKNKIFRCIYSYIIICQCLMLVCFVLNFI